MKYILLISILLCNLLQGAQIATSASESDEQSHVDLIGLLPRDIQNLIKKYLESHYQQLFGRKIPTVVEVKQDGDDLTTVTAVCMSSNGQLAVTLSESGACFLFERELASTFKKYPLLHDRSDPVTAICITSDGEWLLMGSKSGSVKLLNLRGAPTGIICYDIVSSLKHHPGSITSVSLVYRILEQNALCAFIGSSYGIIFVDLGDHLSPRIYMGSGLGKPLLHNGYLTNKTNGPIFTSMSSDGVCGLSASMIDGGVRVLNWDLRTMQPIVLNLETSRRWSVGKYIPESTSAVVGSSDVYGDLMLCDAGGATRHLLVAASPITALCVHPECVISGARRSLLKCLLRDPDTPITSLANSPSNLDPDTLITSLAISHEGNVVLVGLDSGNIQLYDLVLEKRYSLSKQHGARVNSLAISDDGRWGVTVSVGNGGDPTIVFWDLMPPDDRSLSAIIDLLATPSVSAALLPAAAAASGTVNNSEQEITFLKYP